MEAAHKRYYVSSVWKDVYSSRTDDEEDVTILVHMSTKRLDTLNYLAKHWSGPIALSIYGTLQELIHLTNRLPQYPYILDRNNININIMAKSGVRIQCINLVYLFSKNYRYMSLRIIILTLK